jgi:uncharacterized protein (DUF488 family)
MRLYTVGHSTRSVAELIALLQSHRVRLLADVRRFPRSRRHPQFNTENLPDSLGGSGIGYRHLEALGGRRKRRLTAEASPNTGWTVEGFRNFADYAMTPPFRLALEGLLDLARHQTAAIMCAELLWWQCHRRIIADYLLVRGFEVFHILGPGETKPAELTAGAEPQADGTIHYPPAHAPRLES